ncbi:MAG: 50S ribosomal protein L6 [Candidatus Micrarchaeota archaeon]
MVEIPEGVTVEVNGPVVTVKGPKGTLTRAFVKTVDIKVNGNNVDVMGKRLAYVNTVSSVINNMCIGAKDGYEKKMKILFAHFPISLEVKGKEILVKNFLGERSPRKTSLAGDGTKLQVKGQNISITGPDKEAVGQTAANLRSATKIKGKDGRIFQDGIYDEM